MSSEIVLRDFRERRDREAAKAFAKYGLLGLMPGGDSERDVYDYGINELVGLLRYAEMMEHRIRSTPGLPSTFVEEAVAVFRQLSASASRHALDVIAIRQKLLRRGVALGKAEAA